MPAVRKIKRAYRIETIRQELPSQFCRFGRTSDHDVQPALDRYALSGSMSDRDALIELFLPMVTAMAIRRQARGLPNSELDDLISDGCLAVMNVIRRKADLPVDRFCKFIYAAVKLQFKCGTRERIWAGATKPHARQNRTMLNVRSVFLKQHGRMPTGDEIRAALDLMIQNGQIEKEFARPHMLSASAVDPDGVDLLAQLGADRTPGPIYEIISRETMNLALKGLIGVDRTLFKLAIEGLPIAAIAKRVGLSMSCAYNRVNGLLWQARCRADLAESLGCQADAAPPPKDKYNHWQPFPTRARAAG